MTSCKKLHYHSQSKGLHFPRESLCLDIYYFIYYSLYSFFSYCIFLSRCSLRKICVKCHEWHCAVRPHSCLYTSLKTYPIRPPHINKLRRFLRELENGKEKYTKSNKHGSTSMAFSVKLVRILLTWGQFLLVLIQTVVFTTGYQTTTKTKFNCLVSKRHDLLVEL